MRTKRILSVLITFAMLLTSISVSVGAEGGINPYEKNDMSTAVRNSWGQEGTQMTGGWGGGSYVLFPNVDFGEDGAKSVTVFYGTGTDQKPNIKVYAIDGYTSDTDVSANGNNVTVNGEAAGYISVHPTPNGGSGWETEIMSTAKTEEVITGTKTIIIASSAAANLFGIQFSKEEYLDEGLFFDMDLSEYSDSNTKVKNAVTGNSVGIGVYNDEATHTNYPMAQSIASESGVKNYVVTATEDENGNVTERGFINLYKELATVAANAENLTIEGWFRSDRDKSAANYRKLYNLSSNLYNGSPHDTQSIIQTDVRNGGNYAVRISNAESGGLSDINISNFTKGEWTHLVVTRAYDSAANAWKVVVYVNGEKKNTGNISLTGDRKTDYTEANLQIGTIGNDNGKTFVGAIGDFKLYTTALTQAQISEKYNSEKSEYVPLSDTFTLESPEEGAVFSPNGGTLTLNFSSSFTADEAKRAISFKKETGDGVYEDINGGFTVSAHDIGSSAVLSFGKLDDETNYVVLFDNFKALNGVTLDTDKLVLTASSVIYESDFGEYTPNGHLPEASGLIYSSSGENNTNDIYVRETVNGTKYLEVNSSNSENKDSYVGYGFAGGRTAPVKVEFGIGGNNAAGVSFSRGFRINNLPFGYIWEDGGEYNTANIGTDTVKSKTTVTDDGFFRMKYILNPVADTGITYYGYSADDPNFYQMGFDTRIKSISNVTLQQYLSNQYNPKVYVSYIKVSDYCMPAVSSETSYKHKKVEYVFNDDLDASTLSEIKIKDAGENEITGVAYSYNERARRLTAVFENELYINNTYTISFENVRNTSGERLGIKTDIKFDLDIAGLGSDVVFTHGEGEKLETISDINAGGDKIGAAFDLVNMSSEAKKVKVFLAFYEDGRLKNVSVSDCTISADGVKTPVNAEIITDAVDSLTGCSLKLLVWDMENTMKPVVTDNWTLNADGLCL